MKEPPLVIKSLLAALGECGFNDDAVEALVNDFTALMLPDDSGEGRGADGGEGSMGRR